MNGRKNIMLHEQLYKQITTEGVRDHRYNKYYFSSFEKWDFKLVEPK